MAARRLYNMPFTRGQPLLGAIKKPGLGMNSLPPSERVGPGKGSHDSNYCTAFLQVHHHRISTPKPTSTSPVRQETRALASALSTLERSKYPHRSTAPTNRNPSKIIASPSPSTADVAPPLSVKAIQTALSKVFAERRRVQKALSHPAIGTASSTLAENKARLIHLEDVCRIWVAKATWWMNALERGPAEMKSDADVYERIRIVKEELQLDEGRESSVWTLEERDAIRKEHDEWKAETRKKDKTKIAWGPTILANVVLNILLG
ncbi:MAG: hypothetical protein Q9185_006512 [Variospora sp. 1 TL-2023]